jgi:hypothetical protein
MIKYNIDKSLTKEIVLFLITVTSLISIIYLVLVVFLSSEYNANDYSYIRSPLILSLLVYAFAKAYGFYELLKKVCGKLVNNDIYKFDLNIANLVIFLNCLSFLFLPLELLNISQLIFGVIFIFTVVILAIFFNKIAKITFDNIEFNN